MSKADFKGSNLVKSYRLQRDGVEPRVIDSNSAVEEKLERIRLIMPVITKAEPEMEDDSFQGEFVDGLDALLLDDYSLDEENLEYDEEGNPISNVIKAAPQEEQEYDYQAEAPAYEYDGPSPEELVAAAEAQIEEMRQAAIAEIEQAKSAGYEEGKAQGYEDGKASAEREVAVAWQELQDARNNLELEREQMIAELEPQFVHALTSIYEKVFEVDLRDERNLVINLLRSALTKIESTKNYMIHVSREDYKFVLENRDILVTMSMPADVNIDIVEDVTMKSGDCMIETPGGIFDCGLGTQLETLKKKLELLSYTVC